MVVADDLPAQEAVLWGDVAFDVDEAGDLLGVLVGQQQAGQSAHGVPDEVVPGVADVGDHRFGDLDQKRHGDGLEVRAGRGAAAGGVVGQDGPVTEVGVPGDVGVVLLG